MNEPSSLSEPVALARPDPPLVPPETTRAGRWFWALPKWLIGATLSTSFLGAFLVVGWTQRLARRTALYTWWRRSAAAAGDLPFATFARQEATSEELADWPNWLLGAPPRDQTDRGRLAQWRTRLLGSAWRNAKLGLQAAANTWVATAPGCFLWLGGWYFGWQNSFNKGYENAPVGPTTFVLGMLLFSAAMFHVPLALARQASTGDWRRFYDFRLIWTLFRRRWLASLGLSLVWAGAAALAVIVKTAPQYLAGYAPGLMDLPPAEALVAARRFYWFVALGLFPVYVGIRVLAARIYARSLIDAYQRGVIGEDALAENEWQACRRLGLLVPRVRPARSAFVRLAAWLATRTGGFAAGAAVFALWFGLSFFNLMGEFFAKTEYGRGWWNQPMIHLPWFDYTPRSLRHAAELGRPE